MPKLYFEGVPMGFIEVFYFYPTNLHSTSDIYINRLNLGFYFFQTCIFI